MPVNYNPVYGNIGRIIQTQKVDPHRAAFELLFADIEVLFEYQLAVALKNRRYTHIDLLFILVIRGIDFPVTVQRYDTPLLIDVEKS